MPATARSGVPRLLDVCWTNRELVYNLLGTAHTFDERMMEEHGTTLAGGDNANRNPSPYGDAQFDVHTDPLFVRHYHQNIGTLNAVSLFTRSFSRGLNILVVGPKVAHTSPVESYRVTRLLQGIHQSLGVILNTDLAGNKESHTTSFPMWHLSQAE